MRERLLVHVDQMVHFDHTEFLAYLRALAKWTLLGSVVGVLSGTASVFFLFSLDWATATRLANPIIIVFLPLAGFAVGWAYHRFGGTAGQGINLVIEEVHSNRSRIPLRMAPFVLVGTVVTQIFGGSAGREGTAIQMGASLSDWARRLFGLNGDDRRLMIMAGISGGFASVFGTPVAGFIFGMEVQSLGRIRYEGIIPCLVSAFVGDLVTRTWGATHAHYGPSAAVSIQAVMLTKVALAGLCFGLVSLAFIELIRAIKYVLKQLLSWTPLHPVVGGVAILVLTAVVGTRDYLGLSLPLLHDSVDGAGVSTFAFLWKLVFTAVTLGSGYVGGEVTPLFGIGSTCGFTLGRLLEVDPSFMARIGFVAVFAGAANTPLACAVMGVELFGGGSALYLFLGCVAAYLSSGHRGIYVTQRVNCPKTVGCDISADETLRALAERRGGWLPPLPRLRGHPRSRLVSSLMSRPPMSVREDASVEDMVSLALREGVRAIPVVTENRTVVGMVTDNDLRRLGLSVNLTALRGMTPKEVEDTLVRVGYVRVAAIMTRPAVTVSHVASLGDAADILMGANLKRLPVVDHRGHLVGVLTRSDILRLLTYSQQASPELVEDAKLEEVVSVGEDATLLDAAGLMRRRDAKRLIVVSKNERVVGMVVESDLLERVGDTERLRLLDFLHGESTQASASLSMKVVGDVMTSPVICVRPETSADEALRLLIVNSLKRLPVVDHVERPIGLVSRATLMRVLWGERSETVGDAGLSTADRIPRDHPRAPTQ